VHLLYFAMRGTLLLHIFGKSKVLNASTGVQEDIDYSLKTYQCRPGEYIRCGGEETFLILSPLIVVSLTFSNNLFTSFQGYATVIIIVSIITTIIVRVIDTVQTIDLLPRYTTLDC
jgi:hypothetical protein